MNATLYYHLRNEKTEPFIKCVAKPATSEHDVPYYELHIGDAVLFIDDGLCRRILDVLSSRPDLPKTGDAGSAKVEIGNIESGCHRRKLGTVRCNGCGRTVDVIYPFFAGRYTVGICDHLHEGQRCSNAGYCLYSDGVALPAAIESYPEAMRVFAPFIEERTICNNISGGDDAEF